jgi:hypothetical protein
MILGWSIYGISKSNLMIKIDQMRENFVILEDLLYLIEWSCLDHKGIYCRVLHIDKIFVDFNWVDTFFVIDWWRLLMPFVSFYIVGKFLL